MTVLGRIVFCIAVLVAGSSTLLSQDSALNIGSSVDGRLAAGEVHRYSLTVLALTLVSFRAEALDDGLDPILEIYDGANQLVTANDDYGYPLTTDAAIQAFVIPRTATYTIAVSAFGETSGEYRLHVLPGYDVLALHDTEMDRSDWEIVYSEALVNVSESSLFALDIEGLGRSAVVLGLHFPLARDAYFEIAFESVSATTSWQVGLIFRYLAPDRYHRLLLSDEGFWRLDRVEGESTIAVRGWSTHPAIRAGERDFRLGILFSGQHYDVVYNGQVVGSAWDESTPTAGSVGIAMRTDDVYAGRLSFAAGEALLTLPTRVKEDQLFPWRISARNYYAMATELARKQLAPVGGEVKLTLPESSVRRVQAGVTRLPVASDLMFAEFALGASVSVTVSAGAAGGCGIFFHFNDEEHYSLAYLTADGDYGLSRRVGDGFEPGIYGQRDLPPPESDHYLLVIALDNIIHLYVDEDYAGSLDSQPRIGGVGIAAVNYEAANTGCFFGDLWLLSLDG